MEDRPHPHALHGVRAPAAAALRCRPTLPCCRCRSWSCGQALVECASWGTAFFHLPSPNHAPPPCLALPSRSFAVTSLGARVAVLAFCFLALLTTSTYTANLAAFVTVRSITSQISSVAVSSRPMCAREWLCPPAPHRVMGMHAGMQASLLPSPAMLECTAGDWQREAHPPHHLCGCAAPRWAHPSPPIHWHPHRHHHTPPAGPAGPGGVHRRALRRPPAQVWRAGEEEVPGRASQPPPGRLAGPWGAPAAVPGLASPSAPALPSPIPASCSPVPVIHVRSSSRRPGPSPCTTPGTLWRSATCCRAASWRRSSWTSRPCCGRPRTRPTATWRCCPTASTASSTASHACGAGGGLSLTAICLTPPPGRTPCLSGGPPCLLLVSCRLWPPRPPRGPPHVPHRPLSRPPLLLPSLPRRHCLLP